MAYVTDRHVFVHIYKTGGNSVRKLLPPGIELGGVHACAKDVLACDESKGKLSFSVVREPYNWTYSLYTYIRRTNHPLRATVLKMTFYKFVNYLIDDLMKREWKHLGNNYTSQTFASAGCDKIYRLEDLMQDTTKFCNELQIPKRELPFINTNPDRNITTCPKAKELITELFKEDYENFGYYK